MADEAIASVENKLGALIDSLTADELEVFGAVLSDWRQFDDADDVEGFAMTDQPSSRSWGQILGMLEGVAKQRTQIRATAPSDLG